MENNMELPQLTLAQQEDLLKGTKYDGAFNTPKHEGEYLRDPQAASIAFKARRLAEDDGRLNAARAILLARRVSDHAGHRVFPPASAKRKSPVAEAATVQTTKVRPSPADNSAGTTEAEGADCLGQDGGRTERHKPGAGTPGENN